MAHPGHELRIYHWIELNTPTVLILTDGSGRTNRSRLPSTERILNSTGAKPGPIFGRYTDHEIYHRLLEFDHAFFVHLAQEMAEFISGDRIDLIACDAAEGYNTSHDLCRFLVDAACTKINRSDGRQIPVYRFLLVGSPESGPDSSSKTSIHVELDEAALKRKLAAAYDYKELAAEVETAKQRFGLAPFKNELLQLSTGINEFPPGTITPYYEQHGEQQATAGIYAEVIRYQQHIAPLRETLREWGENN